MDSNKFSNWLQIAANIGLIGGLVLVAIQININTTMTEADLASRSWEMSLQYHLSMMGEQPAKAWANASSDPDSLTQAEAIEYEHIVLFWMDFHDREQFLDEYGLGYPGWRDWLPEHARGTYSGSPLKRHLWNEFSEAQRTSKKEWVQIVNQHIQQRNLDAEHISSLLTAAKDQVEN